LLPALPSSPSVAAPLRPHYLGPRDEPWLQLVLDEHVRFLGRKRLELRERLREPLRLRAPKAKLRLVLHVMERLGPDADAPRLSPRDVREGVFRASARGGGTRSDVLTGVAAELGASVDELEACLLCDLAGERRLGALPAELTPQQLALLVNYELVARLLKRATVVRLHGAGGVAALGRQAQRLGLICSTVRLPASDGLTLELSGPFALFRKTALYARALASLLPRAAACASFALEARCRARHGELESTFMVHATDPIFPTGALPREARGVDARFARDFARLGSAWQLSPEPRPLVAPGTLLFPDFELVHTADPARRFALEIVGFWTHRYVAEKLAHYRAAGVERIILCVDERRCCSEAELPPRARVLSFKTRIDAAQVLRLLEEQSP
jgi:predicted nuclease of restriction endonuclease-like RecB superfamily